MVVENVFQLGSYWISVSKDQILQSYICCGFELVMSGVDLSGVIRRLSISFGKGGGLVEYISIAIAAMGL